MSLTDGYFTVNTYSAFEVLEKAGEGGFKV